ncbi:hypothetical protein CGGC5_v004549 [Colletotrichum fructicola Nara gc5]|uniref:Uncharacterized protein n=1 Tax=Colletotrichum fructicola (strain Nara gc5) TaxID=1213859 RepID=A0A7J6JI35_COLFN|nr:hypothetical protein CFRS1_v012278 [Colletotrichum fructicola]KAF4489997.1 hypothetical protein CGGC5_v004549 [Colletotrichum fructicola Nara gc5]KAI8288700.1 hypothetical protein K4K60_010465 [Colletotrichum sp. SAR11_57]KAI8295803.1 hypothetical protein K4K56_010522 [Colletotrichum sp. SAR 10_98]
MHQPPPADQSTFDSQARYNLQATEDIDDEQHFVEEEKKRTIQLPKRPNYKPKPLRWPFITVVILLLGILMALAYLNVPAKWNFRWAVNIDRSTAVNVPGRNQLDTGNVLLHGTCCAEYFDCSEPPYQYRPRPTKKFWISNSGNIRTAITGLGVIHIA